MGQHKRSQIEGMMEFWGSIVPKNAWKIGILDTGQGIVTLLAALFLGGAGYELALTFAVLSVVSAFVVGWVKLQTQIENGEKVFPYKEGLELLAMLVVMLASMGALMGEASVVGFGILLAGLATLQNLYPLVGAYMIKAVVWMATSVDWIMTKVSWSVPATLEEASRQYEGWQQETPSD